MKICILSMQMIENMGSVLQSYALKKTLENLGNQVEFIDIKKNEEDYKLLGDYKQEYKEEKEKTGISGKIKKLDRYAINRLKIKKKSIKQNEVFADFRSDELDINKKSPSYDLGIIGSDEVFNCLTGREWGFTTQLFGNIPEAKKVITYAACCGSTKYDQLPENVINRIKWAFKNVSAFSTRDENTHKFVSLLTDNKSITNNLDPVLIYDFKEEVSKVSLPPMPSRYCVIYSYYNRIHSEEEINMIKVFCKKHKLIPVAVGAPQFWIKEYVVCTPFQCLKIFENAQFVITDTFHGTIFAAKYTNKFAVLIRESNRNKLADLVEKIQMQEHIIGDMQELDNKFECKKNKEAFENIIKKERAKTLEYLKNSIEI